jgi:hypothetical protein
VDDYVFFGEQTGNTFYDAADGIAQTWMFSQYGPDRVQESVAPLIEEMIDLLREMNTFLEDALGTLIGEVILQGKPSRRHVGKVLGPEHDQVSIPFWTAMFSRKG